MNMKKIGKFEVTRLIQHIQDLYLNEKVLTNIIQLICL
jgi:hypothetical protein